MAAEEQTDFDFTAVDPVPINYKGLSGANIKNREAYTQKYKQSVEDPETFWREVSIC